MAPLKPQVDLSLKQENELSWLLFRDFNKILVHSEKWGGRDSLEKQLEDFKEVLTCCELRDLGFRRNSFTWCNNRDGDQWILET